MTDQFEAAKATFQEARDRYNAMRTSKAGVAAGDAPSYSDCAALYDRAALAYKVAGALYSMGMFQEAAGASGEGDILSAAADACHEAAGG